LDPSKEKFLFEDGYWYVQKSDTPPNFYKGPSDLWYDGLSAGDGLMTRVKLSAGTVVGRYAGRIMREVSENSGYTLECRQLNCPGMQGAIFVDGDRLSEWGDYTALINTGGESGLENNCSINEAGIIKTTRSIKRFGELLLCYGTGYMRAMKAAPIKKHGPKPNPPRKPPAKRNNKKKKK
jgi:hypothetical protein